jgi:transposase-like protein
MLTDVLRKGAHRLLAEAVESEVADYLEARQHIVDDAGKQQVVRNGHLPQRTIATGIGPVAVQMPRVRDRRDPADREHFSSKILPPYLRKTRSVEELVPWLYLKGVSTGNFSEALAALLGPDIPGLSATTVTRLKKVWEEDYETWSHRDAIGRRERQGTAMGAAARSSTASGRPRWGSTCFVGPVHQAGGLG